MCGISGFISFNSDFSVLTSSLNKSINCLSKRGPDSYSTYLNDPVGLGHTRLSIIDTSSAGDQPMSDSSGRFIIVFNGEIYNYDLLRQKLQSFNITYNSGTDTEVLLYLYIYFREEMLQWLNGFFAFAIFDSSENTVFIARDRIGIKPIYYYHDEKQFVFASEMKAILSYQIERTIDFASLFQYLQLNYIPAPSTIIKKVKKLLPGHQIRINLKSNEIEIKEFYKIPFEEKSKEIPDYNAAKNQLISLLESSVEHRLISDVPLGAFLSGGIDSSAIVAVASKLTHHLNTYSIGFKDEPYFDETFYAKLVADKFKTNHTVFSLTSDDLFSHLSEILDYIDEPFADSSAIPVYILCKETRKHVTVALSGDGADELFGGYNKYYAEINSRKSNFSNCLIKALNPVWEWLPKSRNSFYSNKLRQIHRYSKGLQLQSKERYWRWCSVIDEEIVNDYFFQPVSNTEMDDYAIRKEVFLDKLGSNKNINNVLYSDMSLLLPNDMLTKVDLMSMANSLEVRVPFLDHRMVEFAFSLPVEYKIRGNQRKRILKDAFKDILPQELYTRNKQGFEVPLIKWFKTDLKDLIFQDLLAEEFVKEQGIFNYNYVEHLKKKLFSNNPEDVQAQLWALIVFQSWYKKYFIN